LTAKTSFGSRPQIVTRSECTDTTVDKAVPKEPAPMMQVRIGPL
jgi:hypothetical protein